MELNNIYEENELKRFQEFLILVVKEDKELEDLIIKFEEENLKKTWTYVLEKIKEIAKAQTYIDDGTKVLEFAKEYFMDYKQIQAEKERKAKEEQERIKAQEEKAPVDDEEEKEEEINLFSF